MKKAGLLFAVLLLLPFVSAEVDYYQYNLFLNNETMQNHTILRDYGFMRYLSDNYNFVDSDKKFEAYVQYHTFINLWNQQNQGYQVEWCNFTITQGTKYSNGTNIVTSILYDNTIADIDSKKIFIQMSDRDYIQVYADCKFKNSNNLLDMPLEFSVNFPSWYCKSCQLYEQAVQDRDIEKTKTLGSYNSDNVGYAGLIVKQNFEILYTLFWIGLILMVYLSIGLIFNSLYWLYMYTRTIWK